MHWKQNVALAFMKTSRATFSPDMMHATARKTPTRIAIQQYCEKKGISHEIKTLEHSSSSSLNDVKIPPPVKHFVTPPSAPSDGPTLLYFHGGGYVNPLRAIGHMPFILRLAEAAKAKKVVLLEYALAPEHTYPTQLVQAVAGLRHLLEDHQLKPEEIIIGGDSAGGQLAGSLLAHIAHPSPYADPIDLKGGKLKAVLFVSPWASLQDPDDVSGHANDDKDYLTTAQGMRFQQLWNPKLDEVWANLGGKEHVTKPTPRIQEAWEQVFDEQNGVVGKAMVTVGTDEILLDACSDFARECVPKAEKVTVDWGTDFRSVFEGKDFVFAECVGEAHVQPALDAALGYGEGKMMRAILAWLGGL